MVDTSGGATARTVTTPDGRSLDVLDSGGDGLPLLYHSGTPGGAVVWPAGIEAARSSGLRWVSYSRPGYGSSTPQPGRTVADAAADSAMVLDALGIGDFVSLGWSGGGPHTLSCAALLPDRCRGAATIASAAPCDAPDLDFLAGMAEDNVEEFTLALKGREVLVPAIEKMAQTYRSITGEQIVEALGGLLGAPDLAALTGPLAEYIAALAREAVRVGVDGWVDDDLAFCEPWGFDLASITVPVAIWQGSEDLMVPRSHGEWLAGHVPGARPHLLEGVGHVSLVAGLDEVLEDLVRYRRR